MLFNLNEFSKTVAWHEMAHQWWGHRGGWQLNVNAATRAAAASPPAAARLPSSSNRDFWRAVLPYAAGALALVALIAAAIALLKSRKPYDRGAMQRMLAAPDAREKRRVLYEIVGERGIDPNGLLNERTELGDRFRALISWLDAASRESLTGDASPADYERRAREFLVELARR